MSIRKYKAEQIVTLLLRQIEVAMANGKTAPQACKEAGIHTQTYYRWRKEYGGLKLDQAKRLKELEKENTRLKRLVAELSREKQGLRENHVWSYDFLYERTHDGRAFRLLTVVDEYTRECLAIDVKRWMNHQDVLDRLAEWFVERGVLPNYIRSRFLRYGLDFNGFPL